MWYNKHFSNQEKPQNKSKANTNLFQKKKTEAGSGAIKERALSANWSHLPCAFCRNLKNGTHIQVICNNYYKKRHSE